ncbi:MAG TPA: G1 family glutamic endopeptidase [Candidatus Binatia bacterium]|nr:G1 family glutamic endopeptidase [Candidatus Binatia bacterium]
MSLQKQKKLVQDFHAYLSKRLVVLYSLSVTAPLLCGVIVFGLAVSVIPQSTKPLQVHSNIVTYEKSTSKATPVQPELSQPATAASKTTTVTPSSPVVAPRSVSTTAQSSASPVEPVVMPSPSSSVSGLTPTTSTPTPAPSSQTPAPASQTTPAVTTSYTSSNWSGYMATTGSYTGISGSWNATNATGNGRTTSADSTWIGIGGVTSADLIQVGTQNIISASGQISTAAFYELLPDSSDTITNLTVSPGDSISASLSEISNGQWTIDITDNTDAESYTITVSYTSLLSSAEWIEEDPSYSFRQQIPFDNFQEASFTNSSTIVGGITDSIAASNAQQVTMLNRIGQTIAVPSAIGTDGASFTVIP